MKWLKSISFIFISILGLCSCHTISKRNNLIIEGHYVGNDSQIESISCDLFIDELSESDYFAADGENVIQDAINGYYYSIEFKIRFSDDHIQQVNFLNFKDAYDGATGTPISYVDDHNSWLTPQTTLNNEILPESECYYSIHIKRENFELFSYLHHSEEEI